MSVFDNILQGVSGNKTEGFQTGYKVNPAYNPKTKKGRSEPQIIPDVDNYTVNGEKISDNIISGIVGNLSRYGYSIDNDYQTDDWNTVIHNPVNTKEELIRERAGRQSAFTQLANGLIQTAGDRLFLGILRGFSDLADIPYALLTGDQDYTNPVSSLIEQGQDAIRNNFEVYRKDPSKGVDFGDLGWYINGATDIASTIALMVPGIGASRGLQALGRLSKIGRGVSQIGDAITASKMYNSGRFSKVLKSLTPSGTTINNMQEGAKLMMDAGLMRIAENYQEARESYKDIENTTLNELQRMEKENPEELERLYNSYPEFTNDDGSRKSYEEIAKTLAKKGATDTFVDDMWLIGLDALQLRGLGNLYKNFNRIGNKVTAAAETEVLNKLGANIPPAKGIAKYIPTTDVAKGYLWELSEGFEEGFQYVNQNTAAARAMRTLKPDSELPTLSDYMIDDQMWNAAIWGAIGGMTFKALGEPAINHIAKRINGEDLSKEKRVEEIHNRFNLLTTTLSDINKLQNGFVPEINANGGIKVNQDGEIVYKKPSDKQIEAKKNQLIKQLAANLTINAAKAGNYEAMKTMFSNPVVQKYIENDNNFDAITAKNFVDELTSNMDNVFNTYLDEVVKATNAGIRKSNIAEFVAHQNTNSILAINEDDDVIDTYNKEISEEINSITRKGKNDENSVLLNLFDEIEERFLPTYALREIENIQNDKAKLLADKDNNRIGLLQYNRLRDFYDKAIDSIIKGLNYIDENGNPVKTLNQFTDYVSKHSLSEQMINLLHDNYNSLLEKYADRAYTQLHKIGIAENLYVTDNDYKKAAKEAEFVIDKTIQATYNNAKTELERIYNKYDSSEKINAIHRTLNPNYEEENNDDVASREGIPVMDIEDARAAFKVMQQLSENGQAEDDADFMAARIGAAKDRGVETPNGPITPEAANNMINDDSVSSEPTVEQTGTIETPPIQPQPTEAEEIPGEANFGREDRYSGVADLTRQIAFDSIKQGEIFVNGALISETEFLDKVFDKLRDNVEFADLINQEINEKNGIIAKTALTWYDAIKSDSNIADKFNINTRSAIDFFRYLTMLPTNAIKDYIEKFLDVYTGNYRLMDINGKIYVSVDNILKHMYKDLLAQNKILTVDDAQRVAVELIKYLSTNTKKYANVRVSAIKQKYLDLTAKYNIQKLFEDAKKSDIVTDQRIGLFNSDTDSAKGTRSEEEIALINGALTRLNTGGYIYIQPELSGDGKFYGINIFSGRPGRDNSVQIGYNTVEVTEEGRGFKLPKKYGKESYVDFLNNEYVSNLDGLIYAVIYGRLSDDSFTNGRFGGYIRDNKLSDEQLKQELVDFKSFMLDFDTTKEFFDKAKNNIVIKYLIQELNMPNVSNNKSVEALNSTNIRQVLGTIYDLLDYYSEYDLNGEGNDQNIIWMSYKNFLAKTYNNYAFTKQLAKRALDINQGKYGKRNKVLKVGIKSFNRGVPIYDDKAKPLSEALARNERGVSSIKSCRIVVLDDVEGSKFQKQWISEDGKFVQKCINDKSAINEFNLLMATGSSAPEFVSLFLQKPDSTTPYGGAVKKELINIFTELLDDVTEPDVNKRYNNADNKLFEFFGYEGVINGTMIARSGIRGVPAILIRRGDKIESGDKSADVKIRSDNGQVLFHNKIINKNDSKSIEELVDFILNDSNLRYTFPGEILFGKKAGTRYIKKEDGKIKINVGGYNRTFDSFAEFIFDSNIAYTRVKRKDFKYKTRDNNGDVVTRTIEGNYDYYNISNKMKVQRPKLTINDDYRIEDIDEENISESQGQTSDRIDAITDYQNSLDKQINSKNKKGVPTQTISGPIDKMELINLVAPRYKEIFEDLRKRDRYTLLRELIQNEIRYNNSDEVVGSSAYASNGVIYLTKTFFNSTYAKNRIRGQYEAMRLLVHESLHNYIHRDENRLNFIEFNKEMISIKEAINDALNNVNSREYEEFNYIEWENGETSDEMRNRFNSMINAINERYKDSRNPENDINEELLVEIMTRREFQQFLNNITAKKEIKKESKTLFQKFLDIILKLFNFDGIKNNSVLAQQFNAIAELFKVQEETNVDNTGSITIEGSPVRDGENTEAGNKNLDNNKTNDGNSANGANTEGANADGEIANIDDVANDISDYDFGSSSIAFKADAIDAPSPSALTKGLSISENASMRSQIEAGSLQLLCQ